MSIWKYIKYFLFKKDWFACDHWLGKLTVDSKDIFLKRDDDGLHETWQCTCTCKCGKVVIAEFAFTTDLYWEPLQEARGRIEQSKHDSKETWRFIEDMKEKSRKRSALGLK